MAEHPYIGLWDKIAALRVSPQEKAVLWCLARHSHWDDGSGAFPSVDVIARATGLSARQVRRHLTSLRCDPVGPCTGDDHCRHRGLLIVQRESSRYRPTMYALDLDAIAFQMHLPEIGRPQRVLRYPKLSKAEREAERFWGKVDRQGPNECWEWTSTRTNKGYGFFRVDGKNVFAHRWAYEHEIGPIPAGLVIDHLCRNHACVNSTHLEPVTDRENILRGTSPSAHNARKTHCQYGHEFTPENTRIEVNGSRRCRTCQRQWKAKKRSIDREHPGQTG